MLAKFFQRLRKELQTIGQIQKMIVESERYTKSIGQVLDDKLHLAVQSVGWSGSTENATCVSNPASPKTKSMQDGPSDNVLGRHEYFITPE